jgi:hypothetical protein
MTDIISAAGRLPAWTRRFDKALLLLNVLLFAWAVLDWLAWSPFPRGYQPTRMVFLSGALLAQALAQVFIRQIPVFRFALLAASIALLVVSMTLQG